VIEFRKPETVQIKNNLKTSKEKEPKDMQAKYKLIHPDGTLVFESTSSDPMKKKMRELIKSDHQLFIDMGLLVNNVLKSKTLFLAKD
jgi:hypothetical protein